MEFGGSEAAMRGMGMEPTAVTDLFFSHDNVEGLQQAIRYQCYLETGSVIGRQSERELLVFMRRALQEDRERWGEDGGGAAAGGAYGGTGDSDGDGVHAVTRGVMALNERVLAAAVPEVVSAYRAHAHYIRDIAQPVPVPLAYAQYTGVRNLGDRLQFPALM